MIIEVIEEVKTIEDAKRAIDKLQEASKQLFLHAWSKGWQVELAAYSIKLREERVNQNEGAGN